jgi:hypothetical protein
MDSVSAFAPRELETRKPTALLLIGARAVQHWFGANARSTIAWDFWSRADVLESWRRHCGADPVGREAMRGGRTRYDFVLAGEPVRVEVGPDGGSEELFIDAECAGPPSGAGPIPQAVVASPASLALIKRSHLYDPAEWHKHVADYHFLKARLDATSTSRAQRAAGDRRLAEWRAQHPEDKGSGSMRIPNAQFFANTRAALIRAYEHDDVHRATCYGEVPLYQKLKDDPSLAYVSGHRFQRLSHVDRVRLVREETYAIALERVVIPSIELDRPWNAERAFQHALRRICTNLTTGWFRDFAIENYPEVCRYDTDFVGRFHDALSRGKVARLQVLPGARPWRERLVDHLAEISALDARSALD